MEMVKEVGVSKSTTYFKINLRESTRSWKSPLYQCISSKTIRETCKEKGDYYA